MALRVTLTSCALVGAFQVMQKRDWRRGAEKGHRRSESRCWFLPSSESRLREAPVAQLGRSMCKKTDLYVEIESVEKLSLGVNALHFSIIAQEIPKAGHSKS